MYLDCYYLYNRCTYNIGVGSTKIFAILFHRCGQEARPICYLPYLTIRIHGMIVSLCAADTYYF
jgi:hypothetical protein